MLIPWTERSTITANLLNPAFCGEVIRRTCQSYNSNEKGQVIPYAIIPLILPILLHKKTRDNMPRSSVTYFHNWVEDYEHLFIDFAVRAKQLMPYSKEALTFLLLHNAIAINDEGSIEVMDYRRKNPTGNNKEEVIEIYKKAELLGKWMRLTGNTQTIFMFLKIRP